MNLVGDEQRRHKKGRSSAEKTFKRINMIILAVHAACFLVPMAYCYIAAGDTFEGSFATPSDFKLAGGYHSRTRNCVFNTTLSTKGYKDVPITITKDTHFTLIAVAAADIRTAFVVYGITLALAACTKLLFDVNFFFIRYRHFVFHKEILSTVEVIFLLGTYYFLNKVQLRADKIVEYFQYCGVKSDSVFNLPAWASLYIGNSVCLAFHAMGFISYLHTALVMDTENLSGIPAHDTPAGIKRGLDHRFQMENQYGSYTMHDADGNPIPTQGDGQPVQTIAPQQMQQPQPQGGVGQQQPGSVSNRPPVYGEQQHDGVGLEEPPSLGQAYGVEP